MNRPFDPKTAKAGPVEFAKCLKARPDIGFADAAVADLCGNLRGKRYPIADAAKLFDAGMQIPASLPLMDAKGEMTDAGGHGFSDGDPDATAWPIPGTLTPVWGASPPRLQMLMQLCRADGEPVAYDPRNVLDRVARRFDALG